MTKKCQKCKAEKQLDAFGRYKSSNDGRKAVCLQCYAEMYSSDNRALGKSWFTARDDKASVE